MNSQLILPGQGWCSALFSLCRKHPLPVTIVTAWLSLGCHPLSAEVVFQNYDGINPDPLGGNAFIYWQPISSFGSRAAVSFTTGAFSYNLSIVTINMATSSAPADFNLRIWSDSSGNPGSSLGLLGNPVSIGAQANYVFDASGITLAASTTYWLEAEPSATSTASFGWFYGTSGTSYLQSAYYVATGWQPWATQTGGAPSALIQGTAIPEPAAYPLVVGLALVVYTAQRRLKTGGRGLS